MSSVANLEKRRIGTLNERPLHAALKKWYAGPDDLFEVSRDGYVIDIVQDGLLVEIQTRNFSAIKRKMLALTPLHRVRLVYPIAREKWIVKLSSDGNRQLGRRKSPKRGQLEQVFQELVSFPQLVQAPNFSLHVLLIQEEELRRHDARRAWRRKGWVTHERRLVSVLDHQLFNTPSDLAVLIPASLEDPFNTAELATAAAIPRWLAQKMAYCLREMGAIMAVSRRRNAYQYIRAAD
jgi:hypothetical protein